MGLYLNPNADAFMEDESAARVFESLNLNFQATGIHAGAEAGLPRRISQKNLSPQPSENQALFDKHQKNLKKTSEKVWRKEKSAYLCNCKRETTLPPEGGTDGRKERVL